MIEATALTFAAVRSSLPAAISSGQATWLISVPFRNGGMAWNDALASIFRPYVTAERAICFEEVSKGDERVFVLVGVMNA